MTYRIQGLDPESFRALLTSTDEALRSRRALRVAADGPGYPCRVSLEEAKAGETLILLNHVSHDVETPFRTSYAIYVRENAGEPPVFEDALPPMLDTRTLGLRAFDTAGTLRAASLAMPGEADARIRELFQEPEIATIHAHNAAHGCFLAKVERD